MNEWTKECDEKFAKIKMRIDEIVKNKKLAKPDDTQSNSSLNKDKNGSLNSFGRINMSQKLSKKLSYSDTNINYKPSYKETEEAAGSTGLINSDGTLNLNMILKGAHSVILKENSIKVCDLTLNILENLISIDIMPSEEIDFKLQKAKESFSLSQSSHAYLNDLEEKYSENFYLACDLVLRNIKWLGCIHCKTVSKSFYNDQLRGKIKLLLTRLHKKNPKRFRDYFKSFTYKSDMNHLMDTFHALFGYCYDPLFGYGHYYPYSSFIYILEKNLFNI